MSRATVNPGTDLQTKPVGTKIRQFIIDNFLFGGGEESLEDDASFLEGGIIDSTGILEIVGYIEEEFGIKVEDVEIVPENLDSVNRLALYIGRKVSR